MTISSQTTGSSATKPTYTLPSLHSLPASKNAPDPKGPGVHAPFARNGLGRQAMRAGRHRPSASLERGAATASAAVVRAGSWAAPTPADWQNAVEASVPGQVFALVQAGQVEAARTLMRAYKMSPDTTLGPVGLDEVVDDAQRRSAARPCDLDRFRDFLAMSRNASRANAAPLQVARPPPLVVRATTAQGSTVSTAEDPVSATPAPQAVSTGPSTSLSAGPLTGSGMVGTRAMLGRPVHDSVPLPSPFPAISPRPTPTGAGSKRPEERPPVAPVSTTRSAVTAPVIAEETNRSAPQRPGHAWRQAAENLAANGRADVARGGDPADATERYEQYDPRSSLLFRLRRRYVDPVRRGMVPVGAVVGPACRATWNGARWVYKVLFVSCSIGGPSEPVAPSPPPPRRWQQAQRG